MKRIHDGCLVASVVLLLSLSGQTQKSSATKSVVFRTSPTDAKVLMVNPEKPNQPTLQGTSGTPCTLKESDFIDLSNTPHPRRFLFVLAGHKTVEKIISYDSSELKDGQPYPAGEPIALPPENLFYTILDHWVLAMSAAAFVGAAIAIFALKAKKSRELEHQAQEQAKNAQLLAQREEEARRLAEVQQAKAEAEQRKLQQEKQRHLDQIAAVEKLFDCELPSGKTGFDKLGKYFKAKRLGAGGYGEVWACCDSENITSSGRVAIKLLLAEHDGSNDFVSRFKREARVARKIQHPNVVRVIDYEIETDLYLVMEYIEGQSLQDLIAQLPSPPMPRTQALELFYQACLGVEALHENDICHRDLKPANIMVDHSGRAVVIDLGNARHREDGGNSHFNTVIPLNGQRPVIGTPGYSPPEAYTRDENEFVASPKMDQYTMGIILTQLMTGNTPVAASNQNIAQEITKVLMGKIDDISQAADLPSGFVMAAKRMTSLDPNARFSTLTEARLALQAALPSGPD